ncbi:uncharacterized protein CANTADRAFT_24379 [Suhomyces tanzawaensis NRRL Y-17324]|uniref:Zn(2)-C6 fungal-type domain-containing protein n=1 Tax=Suhomyces tanzawaensis NRRL Y-17324 TaxID=984487 RepID=A0A1E4SPU4_9ASCO|nr:uncharacterized protein CANTADRAFT_24379 [Suhomyces tanzawaensis NRRL Y-17324]ODV81432.1 hypothetical protein CANTADRAFT_24379 [Suhomyces tanzawaensis NRRL Y-17324]
MEIENPSESHISHPRGHESPPIKHESHKMNTPDLPRVIAATHAKSATPPDREIKTKLKVLGNGRVMKVQKARQRKILSCVYCHSKKIKCSRVQPICNNCEKIGIECKYFVNERISRGGKKSARLTDQERSAMENTKPAPKPSNYTIETSANNRDSFSSEESIVLSPANELKNLDNSATSTATSIHMDSSESRHLESENSAFPKYDVGTHDLSMNYFNIQQNGSISTPHSGPAANNVPNSLLQTPIMNNMSNNITNNFFNTNYSNQPPQVNSGHRLTDELYSFNLSSFALNNESLTANPNVESPSLPSSLSHTNINAFFSKNTSNFLENGGAPNQAHAESPDLNFNGPLSTSKSHEQISKTTTNSTLNNSLNALPSNPATTINYLYGTNTYYENNNLLEDLWQHLPSSKERSFELIDRYVNSVHILLPIFVSLNDFLAVHEQYWELRTAKTNDMATHNRITGSKKSPGSSASGGSPNDGSPSNGIEIDYLQFYTLYFPVLYAATISEFEEYDNLLLNQDINNYLKGFNKICQYYNYPHGLKTIPLLLGNVIIQSTSPNPSAMEMSQIIRYAKFLHLHKDPVLSLGIKNWDAIKFRRLLWWIIFGLDALTSHNFCLPPNCKFEDFNVLMPEEDEPIDSGRGNNNNSGDHKGPEKRLNIGILSMNVKFKYDRIMSELVYHLHNGLSSNISKLQIEEIKMMIVEYHKYIHHSINKMNHHFRLNPPSSVQEVNLINFIKNHSWSFVDRAMMLLHKKILMSDLDLRHNQDPDSLGNDGKLKSGYSRNSPDSSNGTSSLRLKSLSMSQYEDTFGHLKEANIISNLNNSSISLLRFNQSENFSYENMHNNLIPSILHNLNDFLKYNDFIKFGKFNWYVKRTIPLDSIILMFIIITVKFKYEFMTLSELCVYVKLINKSLFILNRKWFKNEKYKRMLSLTNLAWEFILKRYNIVQLVSQFSEANKLEGSNNNGANKLEIFDYQETSFMNMNELFSVMDVPQPILSGGENKESKQQNNFLKNDASEYAQSLASVNNQLAISSTHLSLETLTELMRLNEKIYYDLRNNYVDVNDYCAFYSSLEDIIHELMDFIHRTQ